MLERCAQEKERPFFLAVGFYRPHTPYVAPETYFRAYPRTRISLIEGVEEDQKDMPAMALASHKKEHKLLTDDLRRQARQAYYASITFMDAQVGHDHDALEQTNLADVPVHADQIAKLSEILHDAVTQAFPATRKRPKIRAGTWAPNITDP